MNPTTRAIAGAALSPLSSTQRQKLAAMASHAHRATHASEPFDVWRRDQVKRVTGRTGLREARNEDFNRLKAHFLNLAGKPVAAFNAALKGEMEPRKWALRNLYAEVTNAKDVVPHGLSYVRGFLLNKRGVTIEEADEKSLWHAVFTIRRKAQKERQKLKGGITSAQAVGSVLDAVMATVRKNAENPF